MPYRSQDNVSTMCVVRVSYSFLVPVSGFAVYGGSDVVDNECERTGRGAEPRLFSAVFCSQTMSLAMRPGVTGREDVGVLA